MTDFLQQLIIGLRLGSVYALVALGYTMVYGIIRLINFAHGDFIMVGGYTLYFTVPILLHSMGLPAWTSVIAAIVICALVGVLVELVAYRPVRRKGTSMSALITAIAMSLLLENLAQAIPAMGPNPRVISDEIFSTAPMSLGGVSVNMAAVITIVIAAVVMAALQIFVQKTKLGRAMRAVSENKEASTLVGINVNRTIVTTFAIGSGLAAVAALMYCAQYHTVTTTMGSMLGLKAFVAAVMGGIGLIPGAMLGGIVVGIIEALVTAYISSSLANAVVFLILIVMLLGQVLPDNTYRRVLVPIIWQMCIFILLGTSLNLTLGYLGQLTLGHMGFAGIGAYTAALSSLALERAGVFEASKAAPGQLILVVLGCCLLGAVFAGLLGLLVGIPALRLRGDYLAIVTLGFGLIVENVIANLPFAGGDGLASGTASSSLYANGLGLSTSLQAKYVWLVLGITVLCIALMCTFIRSKYGRAIEAIRDDEIAAAASGVNTTYYKILTFVISAFFAGLAGGLYATCFSSLTTASFTFTSASIWNSTFIVVIVVLGGMGSMTGSVLAAVAMYLLNYEIKNGAWVSALPGFVQSLFQFPMLIYALVLLVVIIFRPRGILGTYEFSLDRLLFDGRLAGEKKAKARKGGADA